MSDIICARCGEPWDSTGGLHYSHSGLEAGPYKLLCEGRGCPCCCGKFPGGTQEAFSDTEVARMESEFVEDWQRSMEHLGEGEYDYYTFDEPPKDIVDSVQYG